MNVRLAQPRALDHDFDAFQHALATLGRLEKVGLIEFANHMVEQPRQLALGSRTAGRSAAGERPVGLASLEPFIGD